MSGEPQPDPVSPLPEPTEAAPGFGTCEPEAGVALPEAPQADPPAASEPQADSRSSPAIPPIVDIHDLDWEAVRLAVNPAAVRARMRDTVERMEELLDSADGAGLLFDRDRDSPDDRAIRVSALEASALWIVGDLHGDLLALEAALALAGREAGAPPRFLFLGDLFDHGGFGLEVLLRVFELIVEQPQAICVLAGNHDEALSYDGARFASTVDPSDFTDFLNANLAHEWIVRAGKLAVRLFAAAPRAVFFPDGLLAAHGGFPLADLHGILAATGNWNDPACLGDFVWTRAHPTARRKMPNRFSRGGHFGYEDLAAFSAVAASLARPVTHVVRGHDHAEERYAIPPAYRHTPLLTTNALSRRLPKEWAGPYERVPTVARYVEGALPQVHRLHLPAGLVRGVYPDPDAEP